MVAQYVYQRPPARIQPALTNACSGVKFSSSVITIMNSVAKLICGQRLPYTTISDSTNVSGTIVSHSAKMCGVARPVASAARKPITLHASISLCLYFSGPGMSTTHAPSAPVEIVKPSSRL